MSKRTKKKAYKKHLEYIILDLVHELITNPEKIAVHVPPWKPDVKWTEEKP